MKEEGSKMLDKSKRMITRAVITGAIVAVPLTVAAAPAMADPAPGVVQAGHGYNDRWDIDRDHRHDRDRNWWEQGLGLPTFNPLWWQAPPRAYLPGGLFGSS